MTDNTQDLSKFGIRELAIAGELLTAYAQEGYGQEFLTNGVAVEFNPNSGMVFLVDEDFNIGVLEDDKLVQFFSCPECGEEGTAQDLEGNEDHKIVDGAIEHEEDQEAKRQA